METGAYVSGAAGSNECPAGSARIETEAACRTAAATAGKTVPSNFAETDAYSPRGCYSMSDNYAYFNTDPVGAGRSARLLCAFAAVTTGAPRRNFAHAGVPRRVQRHCARAATCVWVAQARAQSCGRCCGGTSGASALCGLCGVAATAVRCGMGTGSVCMCAE